MRAIFFYGLFMDRDLLTDQGFRPGVLGPAALSDYRIHIGQRATLVPSPGSRSLGIVMELTGPEADALYAEPSVREYVAEPVQVELLDTGQVLQVECYNLPGDLGLEGTNREYAKALARLARALGFETGYVDEIAAFVERS